MNELSIHIEYLLLTHESIIVPGIGVFEAQQVEALRVEWEEVFLPPRRSISFSDNIKYDDNEVFVKSIQQIYNLSHEEALRKLQIQVEEFHQIIMTEGSLDFGSIGVFAINEDHLILAPCEAGITTPCHYGLDAIHMSRIQDPKPIEKPHKVAISSIRSSHTEITISINRRLLNYVSTIAAAIVLYIFVTAPKSTTPSATAQFPLLMPLQQTEQAIQPTQLPETVTASLETEEEIITDSINAPIHELDDQQAAPEALHQEPEETPAPYCIVAASDIARKNGELYVSQLQSKGIDAYLLEGKLLRVVVGHYHSQQEAADKLRELRQQDTDNFGHAWIYSNNK